MNSFERGHAVPGNEPSRDGFSSVRLNPRWNHLTKQQCHQDLKEIHSQQKPKRSEEKEHFGEALKTTAMSQLWDVWEGGLGHDSETIIIIKKKKLHIRNIEQGSVLAFLP